MDGTTLLIIVIIVVVAIAIFSSGNDDGSSTDDIGERAHGANRFDYQDRDQGGMDNGGSE